MKDKRPSGRMVSMPENHYHASKAPAGPADAKRVSPEPKKFKDSEGSAAAINGTLNVRIPKSLHLKLHESAEKEGVSFNEYIVFLLALSQN